MVNDVRFRVALQIAPFAYRNTGSGSSGVGLIDANILIIDENDRRQDVEAEAIVDTDNVCLEEHDKISWNS